jgi:sugar-specific transcriptional regulator TrmB
MRALEHGAQTVLELTKRTGLSRQATYVAIDSLKERGLMTTTQQGKKTLYSAEHPDKLLAYAKRREVEMKERVKDLERSIPELELQIGGERPIVRMFEGKEGLWAIMEDTMKSKPKHVFEITDRKAMVKIIKDEERLPLRNTVTKFNTHVDGFYTVEAPYPSPKTAIRYILPKDLHDFKSHIQVFDNKVSFVTFEGKMFSVIIEHPAIAKAVTALFTLAKRELKDSVM